MKKKKEKPCLKCQKLFTVRKKNIKYCYRCLSERAKAFRDYKPPPPTSTERFSGGRIIDRSEYKDYIHSDAWVKKANELKYSYPRCNLCFRSYKEVILDVHHKTYLRTGSEQTNDLIVICRDCHSLFSRNYQYNQAKGFHEPKGSLA